MKLKGTTQMVKTIKSVILEIKAGLQILYGFIHPRKKGEIIKNIGFQVELPYLFIVLQFFDTVVHSLNIT